MLNNLEMIEKLLGCKWSLRVYELIESGISRPGKMQRSLEGLSRKVLTDCLNKNIEFRVLNKTVYPESPPHVEYHFTEFGKKIVEIIFQIKQIKQ